jgi:hypothetical protein
LDGISHDHHQARLITFGILSQRRHDAGMASLVIVYRVRSSKEIGD